MGNKMLVVDGVKYAEWIPQGPRAEDEFEQVVKEHTQDIFGEQSIYLDMRQKLKSGVGTGSIPDGFVIVFGDSPHWHIVEVELSSHPLHDHIDAQVGRFISGIENPRTQNNIVNAIYDEITKDDFLKLRLRKSIGLVDIHRFLADLILKPPILTIIIEKASLELSEALKILRYPQEIKVVEFQTFTREGVGLAVHAHLFEPLYKRVEPPPPPPPPPPGDSVEITLKPWQMKYPFISIPARKDLFPDSETKLTLETDIGVIEANFIPKYHRVALSKWFKAHPELKAGDKINITVIEQLKRYRLEIVK